MPQMPLLDAVLRARYAVLIGISALMLMASVQQLTGQTDWQYFSWGSDLLFGDHPTLRRGGRVVLSAEPGGLHLYANYAFLQIGPPGLLLARALRAGPGDGVLAAGVVIQALGLMFVLLVDRAFTRPAPGRAAQIRLLVGGSLVLVVWGAITHFRHLDDALTLTAMAAAALALTKQRPVLAGALLGLAAASKPWGLPLIALVLVPPTWRLRTAAFLAAAGTVALFWAPFVAADLETLRVGQVVLAVAPDSALHALGVAQLGDGQNLRLAQLGLGLVLAAVIVWRGWWPLAPLGAFALRLLFEPSTYSYYPGAVVAAAFLADAAMRPARLPVLTVLATAGWVMTESTSGSAGAAARLGTYGVLLVMVLAMAAQPRSRARMRAS